MLKVLEIADSDLSKRLVWKSRSGAPWAVKEFMNQGLVFV